MQDILKCSHKSVRGALLLVLHNIPILHTSEKEHWSVPGINPPKVSH